MPPRRSRAQKAVYKSGKAPKSTAEPERNLGGRPSSYSIELATKICAAIGTTTRSLPQICDDNPEFPRPQTIWRWLATIEEFRDLYRLAKLDQTNLIQDELLAISDTPKIGEITTQRIVKGEKPTSEVKKFDMIEHRRLQIETRRWLLSKLRPREYGERVEIDDGRDPLADLVEQFDKRYQQVAPSETVESPEEPKPDGDPTQS